MTDTTDTTRTVDDYLALPYTVTIVHDRDEDGNEGYVAAVDELPGCMAQGATAAEAAERIRDAMHGWLEAAIDIGATIPEPRTLDDFSGRFLLRVPRSLHADLARRARQEGVSLNSYAAGALAGAVGWNTQPPARKKRSRG